MQYVLSAVIFSEAVRPPGGGELKSYMTRDRDGVELLVQDNLLLITKGTKRKIVSLSLVKEGDVLDVPTVSTGLDVPTVSTGPGVAKSKA